jgi:hypothetical protein
LYGQDGATLKQCFELSAELAQYVRLCEEIGSNDMDREIIDEASYYIPAYRDYLTDHKSCGSFTDYIETHNRRSRS